VTLELAHFRKYSRKIREFRDFGSLGRLSSEVFLVSQCFSFSEPLLPGLELSSTTAEPVPFILLYIRFPQNDPYRHPYSQHTTILKFGRLPTCSTPASIAYREIR